MSAKKILNLSPFPRLLLTALFFMAAAAAPVFATDYYVDGLAGSDAGSGGYDAPWKTISQALKHARGTDTIYIRCATYVESLNLAPVPLRGVNLTGIPDGDEIPVISSADSDTHTISLMNYKGAISRLDITGAVNANGINCIARGGSNLADISRCRIHGNNTGVHATTFPDSSAICSPYIHNNTIFSNRSRGIGNMVYSSAIIDNNYIYANGDGSEGSGGIGNRDYSHAEITGNVIYGNNLAGITVRDNAAPKIINNTVYGHDFPGTISAGIRCNPENPDQPLVILNNIISDNGYGLLSKSQMSGRGNDYNNIWNNSIADYSNFERGEHDISAAPLFVDAPNADFHLQAGSPCIDMADNSTASHQDIDGVPRPQGSGCDIGAYEFSAQQLPAPPEFEVTVSGLQVTFSWDQTDNGSEYITLFYAPPDLSYLGSIDLSGQPPGITVELWHGATFYVALKRCSSSGCSNFSNIGYIEIQ